MRITRRFGGSRKELSITQKNGSQYMKPRGQLSMDCVNSRAILLQGRFDLDGFQMKKMKPTESIETGWPMREVGQDGQSTLDIPVRIKVVDLWAGIRKEPYVKELHLTYRRSSVLASRDHGQYLEACAVRDSHD